jgi:hypothetical protein
MHRNIHKRFLEYPTTKDSTVLKKKEFSNCWTAGVQITVPVLFVSFGWLVKPELIVINQPPFKYGQLTIWCVEIVEIAV